PFGAGAIALALRNRRAKQEAIAFGRILAFVWGFSFLIVATNAHSAWVAVPALCAFVCSVPEIPIHLIAIPLGLVRLAWLLDRLLGGTSDLFETRVHAALPAARALLRRS